MAKIAVLIGPEFEDSEYAEPARAFREAGHDLVHIGMETGTVRGKQGKEQATIDATADQANVDEYDALFIPGGHSPDNIRRDENVVRFAQEFAQTGKPILAICHGPQILMAADQVQGRTLTAWRTVQHDLQLAGVDVKDEAVVTDRNLVTSRQPDDIPQFIDASLAMLERAGGEAGGKVGAEA
jgi:protease I